MTKREMARRPGSFSAVNTVAKSRFDHDVVALRQQPRNAEATGAAGPAQEASGYSPALL